MRISKIILLAVALFVALGGVALAASSANYRLPSMVLSSAGGEKASISYRVVNTVGQPAAGALTSTNYKLQAGFLGAMVAGGAPEPPIIFPDANLEAVIRDAIGKPSGDIYPADLLTLTTLIGSNAGIIDLTGLEYCVNLTNLQLYHTQISDISPLQDLTSLTHLYLHENQISDISPLQNLTSLNHLTLHKNQISDISPLQSLTNLKTLLLPYNQISDISPLSSLTNLITLSLYSNQISDISPLQSLTTNLTTLYLGSNQISDISPLQNLTSLTYLYLNNNWISDIQPLVDNAGLAEGDSVDLTINPLSLNSINDLIPLLVLREVAVDYIPSADSDGDGIFDVVDVVPGSPSVEFSDGTTLGSIVSLGPGITILIADAPDPADGIQVVVSGPEEGSATITVNIAGGSTLNLPPGEYIFTTSAADDRLRTAITEILPGRNLTLQRTDSKAFYQFVTVGRYYIWLGSIVLEVSDGGLAEVEYIIGGASVVVIVESGEIVNLDEHLVDGEVQEAIVTAVQGDVTVNGVVVLQGDSLSVSANQPPVVGNITAPLDPLPVGTAVTVSASFTDPDVLDTHTALWDWGDGNTLDGDVDETNGSGTVGGSHTYAEAGVYTITLTVSDDDGGESQSIYEYVVVYDPEGGFVTSGGWLNSPEGAYTADPSLTGKATFGFVSKYKKGATTPTGNTEFQFKAGNLNFHSSSYEWLVITGSNYVKFKGTGTINNEIDSAGNPYKFMLWAGDGNPDTFRIKIWEEDGSGNESVIYDNGFDQDIGGGSIVVHTNK